MHIAVQKSSTNLKSLTRSRTIWIGSDLSECYEQVASNVDNEHIARKGPVQPRAPSSAVTPSAPLKALNKLTENKREPVCACVAVAALKLLTFAYRDWLLPWSLFPHSSFSFFVSSRLWNTSLRFHDELCRKTARQRRHVWEVKRSATISGQKGDPLLRALLVLPDSSIIGGAFVHMYPSTSVSNCRQALPLWLCEIIT